MSPPAGILDRIVRQRRMRVRAVRRGEEPSPVAALGEQGPGGGFLHALEARRGHAVIAEVKLGSPRLGRIAGLDGEGRSPESIAESYARSGAAALSVVVEPDFFFGSHELLRRCQRASGLPAIAKDFVIDPLQIDWAADAGAAAVLLVAALLDEASLRTLAAHARVRGLVPLVELHDGTDLDRLGDASWELVGVNCRDLRTFEVDLGHAERLLAQLPVGAVKVAESGIRSPDDVERLRDAGYDAFLIGETLMTSSDPGARLRELLS